MIALEINMTANQNYYSDTDSLMYDIQTEDLFEDFSSDKDNFDFSNYLIISKYYDNSTTLVIGKMKDVTRIVAIE